MFHSFYVRLFTLDIAIEFCTYFVSQETPSSKRHTYKVVK